VGHGQLDFDGKNGELELFLSGPLGKRDFSVYFHDERNKDEGDADSVSVASE
jgi:hypothetical protein